MLRDFLNLRQINTTIEKHRRVVSIPKPILSQNLTRMEVVGYQLFLSQKSRYKPFVQDPTQKP